MLCWLNSTVVSLKTVIVFKLAGIFLGKHSIANSLEVCMFVQVGNAFVSQYYNVLHQSPHVVHRFYTDASHLTRAEAGADGALDTVSTQQVGNYIFPIFLLSISFALVLVTLSEYCHWPRIVLKFILQLLVLFHGSSSLF